MKNGLYHENGELIYYVNDKPKHAGLVKVDDAIYYISSDGRAVTGQHIVHRVMSNGILKHGTYTFGSDYKLVEGSYIAPKKRKIQKSSSKSRKTQKHSKLRKKIKPKQLIPAILLLICLLAGATLVDDLYTNQDAPVTTAEFNEKIQQMQFSLPTFEEEVLLCSESAKSAYDKKITVEDALFSGDPYAPFIFRYNLSGADAILLLSEKPDLKDAKEYVLNASDNVFTIDNLKVATAYYYKVVVDENEFDGSFRTAESTRFVSIPGVKNTRDIGGYVTLDGKRIKQGMLIRGTELDGLVVPTYTLELRAREDVQNAFGFVYDLDLREATLYSGGYQSPFGQGVGHQFYTSPQYGQIFNINWKNSLKQIFSDLADPDKYPMYLHCSWGQDRTGTIVFLLHGILNLPLEDMIYDYHLSGFNNPPLASSQYMDAVILGLEAYEGNTIQEKIVNYLTTFVGITDNEIQSIRDIFLEESSVTE